MRLSREQRRKAETLKLAKAKRIIRKMERAARKAAYQKNPPEPLQRGYRVRARVLRQMVTQTDHGTGNSVIKTLQRVPQPVLKTILKSAIEGQTGYHG